jgi:asparagine synthase (glutamine-hydrolysing)
MQNTEKGNGGKMSGICGIVYHQPDRPVDRGLLQAINSAMRHRGPDGDSYYIESGVGLAVRGLSAPGEHEEWKPGQDSTGTICTVLDGRVYNRTELRAWLEKKGHSLPTGTDAEIIAHHYRETGERFVQSLVGEFAIATWNSAQRTLSLVRDRLGVKPLYYAILPDGLIFASELVALLQYPDLSRDIDLAGFSEYLTFAHTVPPHTILADVKKLAAGHMLVYRNKTGSTREYWDLCFAPESAKSTDEAYHVRQFQAAFEKAVARRLAGNNQPTGAFLSGGMDSSSIVGMMAYLGEPLIYTYSGGCRQANGDSELTRAAIVARHFDTRYYELSFTYQDFLNALPRFIRYMDDPVADAASIIRMLLAGRARQDGVVVLGGEAGDDITGGYSFATHQMRFDRLRRFQRMPVWLRCKLPGQLKPVLPSRLNAWLARGNRDLSTINAEEHFTMVWAFDTEEKRRYCPPLQDEDDHCHALLRNIYARSGTSDPLSQALYVFTKLWAAENMMMSADKMTMSHSVEFRAPFLDHELVETAVAIPSQYKVRRDKHGRYIIKYVLKQAMRDILPLQTMELPKSPFHVPITMWFQNALGQFCRDVLLSENASNSGLYDIDQISTLLSQHRTSPREASMVQIRNLLFFEMWRQTILPLQASFRSHPIELEP